MTLNTFDDILQFFFKCCNTEQAINCSIWFNSREDLLSVKDKIEEMVETKTSHISRVYRDDIPTSISFENGSCIEILTGKRNIRGKRYILSAFEGKINDNSFFENVIIPCSAGGFFPKQFNL